MSEIPTVRDAFSSDELELLASLGVRVSDGGIQRSGPGAGLVGTVIPERARMQPDLVRACAVDYAHAALAAAFGVDPDRNYIADYEASIAAELTS